VGRERGGLFGVAGVGLAAWGIVFGERRGVDGFAAAFSWFGGRKSLFICGGMWDLGFAFVAASARMGCVVVECKFVGEADLCVGVVDVVGASG
jgi:hypothetical protein